MSKERTFYLLFLGLLATAGCSGAPPALEKPAFNPSASASKAIEDADQDGSGTLTLEELKSYPSLARSISQFDTNNDGEIAAEEIEKKLQYLADSGAAIRTLPCLVTLKGRPLQGALIEFTPEPFLKGIIKPCSGVTGSSGRTALSMSKEDLPADLKSFAGVNLGFYQVRVTHPKIKVPAKYNVKTKLGEIVVPSTLQVVLNL